MPRGEHSKQITFVVDQQDRQAIMTYAETQGGVSAYIRRLIERDMRRHGKHITLTDIEHGGRREPQSE